MARPRADPAAVALGVRLLEELGPEEAVRCSGVSLRTIYRGRAAPAPWRDPRGPGHRPPPPAEPATTRAAWTEPALVTEPPPEPWDGGPTAFEAWCAIEGRLVCEAASEVAAYPERYPGAPPPDLFDVLLAAEYPAELAVLARNASMSDAQAIEHLEAALAILRSE